MEFLRAIGPVFNFLLLAGALFFLTRKRIRKLFQDRKERIADALGRAADAQDQARHTAEDIAEAQQTADAQAQCQLADAQRQAAANTPAADADTARQAEALRRMKRIDKERTEYHRYFTGREWMDMENYDLPINASRIDYDQMIQLIKDYLKLRGFL